MTAALLSVTKKGIVGINSGHLYRESRAVKGNGIDN